MVDIHGLGVRQHPGAVVARGQAAVVEMISQEAERHAAHVEDLSYSQAMRFVTGTILGLLAFEPKD